ncbi:hypothetical protein [Campylobacter cuniculorum]|uniref:Uncharacterized protein n=2 Tax=Campylobacter cuniculorum TaxID=374106 RepID=A0A1W6BUY8_9BACT|nr:hypothetical protein [Campylobacter cuniculorum]ARJ55909.1 hypothetical protein CCUN_0254 [Campylobacter cuniculorum DSM 23162 = LMG 24588]QOR05126.1 hypothetical protein A0071_04135 [Campylobacter cuniculorum]
MFSLSSLITSFIDIKIMIIIALGVLCAIFYTQNELLSADFQKEQLKNLHLQNEKNEALKQILAQNEAIERLKIVSYERDEVAMEALERIDFKKDEHLGALQNCENELKSFKDLFNVLSKAN